MTHPTDYFLHPKSGQGLHTQESGDAGLSSNMEHNFSDDYNKSALPVADKGSFVGPIPIPIFEHPGKIEKIWSGPAVCWHSADPKSESHTVSAEEGVMKPTTLAVVPPQAKLTALPENSPQKETRKGLLGATPITEGQPDTGVVAEDSCIMDTKMDTEGNPPKPKDPPLVPGAVRKNNHHRKRATGKNRKLYLLCWMAVAFVPVPVSGGFPAKCFKCMDKDKCPKLVNIYETDEIQLYHRDLNQTFPGCSGISSLDPKRCAVCRDEADINIICSHDVETLEVEDSDGEEIPKSLYNSTGCLQQQAHELPPSGGGEQQQTHGRARFGLILSVGLFVVAVAVLAICSCCQKNRNENGQQ